MTAVGSAPVGLGAAVADRRPARSGWREVPGVPPAGGGSGDGVLAWLVAVAGAVGWSRGPGGAGWTTLAVIAALGALGVWAARSTWCRTLLQAVAVALAATATVTLAGNPWWIGAWVGAGVLVGWWVLGGRGVPRTAVVPVAVLSVVSGVLAWWGRPTWMVALAAVGAVVLPLVMLLIGARGVGLVERFAHGVWLAVTWLLFGLLSVGVVLVPFAWGRLVRSDGFGGGGRWAPPPRRVAPARAAWSNDRPTGTWSWWRAGLACGIVACLTLTGWRVFEDRTTSPDRGFTLAAPQQEGAPPEPEVPLQFPAPEGLEDAPTPNGATPAAMADSPWWGTPEYQQGRDYILNWITAWRHENPHRFLDASSPYINVVDGIRSSWTPPPCDCRRLTVWMYGGSTTWGIGQRDDHTIPSELARVATERGITLDVQNRGITGFTHWMESERLAWDLTSNPRPDLVVFYDGVNEIYSGNGANDFRATNEAPVDAAAVDNWRNVGRLDGERPEPPSSGGVIDTTDDPLGPVYRARDSVARYDRTREMSRSIAEQNDLPVRYFWQPSRYDRPLIPGEPHWSTWQENDMRRMMQVAADSLPSDVVNLREVLAGDTTPMFTDDVHHNEKGARIVAEAMFRELEPQLRALGARPPANG